MCEEKKTGAQNPVLPNIGEQKRWPSPLPLPTVPNEDVRRLLRQILQRLDIIEKRLENIEKILMERQRL
ncbi:MAG: hypothetical protein QW821_03850 [Candidatus Bathyarchaeia archaeon]